MEDLKVVLYIVVAIIWVVYNNYKKIVKTSASRDPSKQPKEIIQENWPKTQQKTVVKPVPVPQKVSNKPVLRESRKVLERRPLPERKLIRQQKQIEKIPEKISSYQHSEGGILQPSKIVHFEEQETIYEEQNPLLNVIRTMNLREGIVLAEVLRRPYN